MAAPRVPRVISVARHKLCEGAEVVEKYDRCRSGAGYEDNTGSPQFVIPWKLGEEVWDGGSVSTFFKPTNRLLDEL